MADMATTVAEVHDLLILVDATSSMGSYLDSLNNSLPQIISISTLTNAFERIGLLAYRDYTSPQGDLLEWSGWTTLASKDPQPDLIQIARGLQMYGGYSYPEAVKTGLAKAYEVMREDAKTLILLYADAPPHLCTSMKKDHEHEQEALLSDKSFGGYGPKFSDWVSASRMLRNGPKKAQVICLLDGHYGGTTTGAFDFLSTTTDGACLHLMGRESRLISEMTIEILLAWMGVKKAGTEDSTRYLNAKQSEYKSTKGLSEVKDEKDPNFENFVAIHDIIRGVRSLVETDQVRLSASYLEQNLSKRATPVEDFAKTYKRSTDYRALVTTHLRELIDRDVTTISLNPVFGSLWRAVCNDRESEQRQELLDLFGRKVDKISNAGERAKMKVWLEESYDYTAEVLETIATVPESLRFPCVCLDPTIVFSTTSPIEDDDDGSRAITSFKRDELLEIGRSCDSRILRRLGKVLTRLTFIESASSVPAHLAAASETEVPKIPMALATEQYGRKFWRILLHIVVPGTMLGARASSVLAALAIRLGIHPLIQPAENQMMLWRDKWNDIDVPEIWNVNCLSLLLDADATYRRRKATIEALSVEPQSGLLTDKDRTLFERLIEYRMLELNLATTLTARVAWTPQHTSMPMGSLVRCKTCEYPRSVTIMGPENVCGLCCVHQSLSQPEADEYRATRLSCRAEETNAYWYECNAQTCHAQYVVYNVEWLKVRAKCHYCRVGEVAPVVECTRCLSRVIWPEEYRSSVAATPLLCVACQSGTKATVVDIETQADRLVEENGQHWLITNNNDQIKQVFNNRSLFHTASTSQPLDSFYDNIQIVPGRTDSKLALTLRGKQIQNTAALLDQLFKWITSRRAESGTCSLCFSNNRKIALQPACGRSGCRQTVCTDCLKGWYGLNAPGRIINTAALHCPFCRRAPSAKRLARNGAGVHAVGQLKQAVDHAGEWIFAWCADCGYAKPYIERVCAGGAPAELSGWSCEECEAAKGRRTRKKIQACPGCGVETEKIGGCDHITCVCGTHWCWYCGTEQSESGIYTHMALDHGGYYDGLAAEDYEEDEDDW